MSHALLAALRSKPDPLLERRIKMRESVMAWCADGESCDTIIGWVADGIFDVLREADPVHIADVREHIDALKQVICDAEQTIRPHVCRPDPQLAEEIYGHQDTEEAL